VIEVKCLSSIVGGVMISSLLQIAIRADNSSPRELGGKDITCGGLVRRVA